jgi:metal-responsive CopG/Arc/MetJ family transcriptional regulator
MGRKKLWTERLTLPLTAEMVARMDAALAEGEARLDLIRAAIERELKRRERKAASGSG